MRALSPYVDFGGSPAVASGGVAPGTPGDASKPATLRKGLWLEDVEALLGPLHDSVAVIGVGVRPYRSFEWV